MSEKEKIEEEYRANFLWGSNDELDIIGYEFANAITEKYQEACWDDIKKIIIKEWEAKKELLGVLEEFIDWHDNLMKFSTVHTDILVKKFRELIDKYTEKIEIEEDIFIKF